ncbi:MAG: AAA family ATPase [Saprospiraceae bacterium]
MEQPTANNQDTFIERVRLQGYKSIEDVEITFKPGLNILIGANGSGKTNFVRFLEMTLSRNFEHVSDKVQVEVNYRVDNNSYLDSLEYRESSSSRSMPNREQLFLNGEKIFEGEGKFNFGKNIPDEDFEKYKTFCEQNELYFSDPLLVSYGVTEKFNNIGYLERILIFDNQKDEFYIDKYSLFIEPHVARGIFSLFRSVVDSLMTQRDDKENDGLAFPINFVENLRIYTPVKDIQLEPGYRIESTKNGKEILHARFEFLVDGKWCPWTQLSDGTKRLIYIITEVTFANNIILLEEPELGIHPHQLSKLMDFLEAAAEHKQIILTTHSPQVLNVLPLDGLDRIIVVRYDKENGTKMSHLTEEEQQQARTYMEAGGLYLSDYWVYSDLEKEIEAA